MRKAKIILAVTLLLAAAGGTIAFKAMRNGQPTYWLTNIYITNQKLYTCPIAFCLSTTPFVTLAGPLIETWYTTTSIAVPTTVVTCTATDGSGSTITLRVPRFGACTFDYTRVTMPN